MLIAATVIHLTASQSARAADIVPRSYPAPAPPPVYAPPVQYLWTGCYVGGNIGGAWSNVDLSGVSGVNFSASNGGVAGGSQIGCDYQWNRFWVVGVRDMAKYDLYRLWWHLCRQCQCQSGCPECPSWRELQIQFLASTRKGTCRDLVTGDGSRNLGRDGGRLRTRPDLANPV